MMKNNGCKQLHVFFFPFMAQGHTIPMLDIANLFASRGHRATIVTTPLNEPSIRRSVEKFNDRVSSGIIATRAINFPTPEEAGLPEGCENMDFITSRNLCDELVPNFFRATTLLRPQLESLMEECKPDCLVADSFFPWSTAAAAERFGIPRLIFNGMGFFAMSVLASENVSSSSDGEEFLVQGIPDRIFLTRGQLPEAEREEDEFLVGLFKEMKESESKSFGVIFNSFYELEPTYADYYRNQLGRRAWHIGPVSLGSSNRGSKNRGDDDDQECLKWLDTKDPDSVIYICFGSMVNFGAAQLKEIAEGLESSGQHFIWVVRKNPGDPNEDWLPEGFEERTAGRGLIIRGWAPQVRILEHEAIGGFLTHCGWNSTLEAVSAGVPLVAWPVQAEQFLNEKLVTEVAKIGASVGVKEGAVYGGIVGRERIEKAVRRVMVGEEGEEMRRRVKELAAMAAQAVEEGGSSYSDFDDLIGEIQSESCCR